MSRYLSNRAGFSSILLFLMVVVGCSKNEPEMQGPRQPERITSSTASSEPPTADRCKTIGKVAGEANNIVVCSFAHGKTFNPGTALKFSISDAILQKEIGKEWVVIRDFANWMPQISSLDFTFEFETNTQKELTSVKVLFPAEDFPSWETMPLFVERIDLRTGHSILQPLKELPSPEVLNVAGRFAEINVPRDQLEKNAQRNHMERLEFLYSNLFAIRDYGFYDPVQSKKYLDALDSWSWNDGEVAEVAAVMKVEVDYLKGKTIEIPNAK